MPGGIGGAHQPVPAYPIGEHKGVQAESLGTPEEGTPDLDSDQAYLALVACFPGVDRAIVKSWKEELFSRLNPPELDLRIATGTEDRNGQPIPKEQAEKNKAFARCVHEMGPAVWAVLQRAAARRNGFGITVVWIGASVNIGSRVAQGLGKLNVEVLYLDREISPSLEERLRKAGVRKDVCRTPTPELKPADAQQRAEQAKQSKEQRTAIRDARLGFAMAKPADVEEARTVTAKLIRVAHDSWSKLDRPLMKRLAQEIGKGNESAVRGTMRAVLAPEAPLDVQRRVDLLMARAPSDTVSTRAESPRRATEKKATTLSDLIQDSAEREQTKKRVAERRKVFVPQLSAFVEEPEILEPDDEIAAALDPPLLHRLCGSLPPDSVEQFDAIGAYVEEILDSDLPADQKEALCVSMYASPRGEASAARRAMDAGNPGAAAAIVLAIMESGNRPVATALLPKLGVNLRQLVDALDTPQLRQDPWFGAAIARLNAAIARS